MDQTSHVPGSVAFAPRAIDTPVAPVRERIAALDVLRGVAVAGILLANVFVFFGHFAIPEARLAALPTATADRTATFLEHVFVQGKFYSIFSLLFGIGFGLQLARGGDAVLPRFKRRLRILLGIGAIHALFLWAGDILLLYALLGFAMPWFARKSDGALLRWTAILLAIPTALYVAALAAWMAVGPDAPASGGGGMPPGMLAMVERMGTGGVVDAFRGNLVLLIGRWMELFMTVRFPKVLGMFVLGLWTVRAGIAISPAAHRTALVRWAVIGWSLGLPVNVVATWASDRWDYLPPSVGGLLGVAMQAIGFPLLALGYAATVGLLVVDGRRLLNVFAPLGRMALTSYLTHSLVCVLLSYGFGLGLFWRVGATYAMAIALIIVAVQIPLSALWLGRFRFGPVEWVWRRLTYGRPI